MLTACWRLSSLLCRTALHPCQRRTLASSGSGMMRGASRVASKSAWCNRHCLLQVRPTLWCCNPLACALTSAQALAPGYVSALAPAPAPHHAVSPATHPQLHMHTLAHRTCTCTYTRSRSDLLPTPTNACFVHCTAQVVCAQGATPRPPQCQAPWASSGLQTGTCCGAQHALPSRPCPHSKQASWCQLYRGCTA